MATEAALTQLSETFLIGGADRVRRLLLAARLCNRDWEPIIQAGGVEQVTLRQVVENIPTLTVQDVPTTRNPDWGVARTSRLEDVVMNLDRRLMDAVSVGIDDLWDVQPDQAGSLLNDSLRGAAQAIDLDLTAYQLTQVPTSTPDHVLTYGSANERIEVTGNDAGIGAGADADAQLASQNLTVKAMRRVNLMTRAEYWRKTGEVDRMVDVRMHPAHWDAFTRTQEGRDWQQAFNLQTFNDTDVQAAQVVGQPYGFNVYLDDSIPSVDVGGKASPANAVHHAAVLHIRGGVPANANLGP